MIVTKNILVVGTATREALKVPIELVAQHKIFRKLMDQHIYDKKTTYEKKRGQSKEKRKQVGEKYNQLQQRQFLMNFLKVTRLFADLIFNGREFQNCEIN